jgi:hypothetical protein
MNPKQHYINYLNSAHWQQLKTEKCQKTPKRCAICASTKNIHLHHLLYKDLVDVTTQDLRWLCKRCHFLAHDLVKQGVIKFTSTDHNSRFALIKNYVKISLGLLHVNLFHPKKNSTQQSLF